ncbi:capsule assembly Wzi family protein [Aliivibrio finisterrensis]|uniref:capsule assembly Wzi family protein n=1 Tax=Aliivibrio finisterrensis TaxID=511998 RepID=UPI00101F086D|nr:capsule assembly Wzi family protein [Aliivibrio finisterrensis]RYU67828.1 capsule assembly Wzi family protein [Aliivibrio finisterrensis]RYU71487.1 capsule assembly Wzi family protein [Aliivibrio finisterrensis]RYU74649.1 capsule assembly Wzi family protein [Aliivibrio finisterrensis]
MNKPLRVISLLSTFLFGSVANAAPWIEPNDLHLRADIQLLANAGVITVPITTYPLMWDGIINNIKANSGNVESGMVSDAVRRVQAAFSQSQNTNVKFEIGGATEPVRFQHFGSPVREQGEATAAVGDSGSWWSYNLEATYSYDAPNDEEVRLDGSYIAAIWGNWVFSAGYQEQWYGPGWDTTLLKSTNARPLPGLSLTRHNPEAFDVPVLEWLGPWTMTTGVSKMDDERYMDDTLLWTFRGTIKPHPNFEFGVSRAAQLCGNNPESGYEKSCNLDTWWRMFTGDTNVWSGENPANQLASVDARWGDTFNGVPYSIYWESMGEDAFRIDRFPPFQAKSYLYGADVSYQYANQSITTFVEYSETMPMCGGVYGCAYEHSAYKTGYRYNKRVMGSTYDNDANTYTLGFIGFAHKTGHRWKANVRYLELNKDNLNKNVGQGGGNQVAPIAENAWNMDISYLFPISIGEIELAAEYTHSEYPESSQKDDNNLAAWGNWTHRF